MQVIAVRTWTGTTTVYDLSVSDLRTYYVSVGGTPVLVHNEDGGGLYSPPRTQRKDPDPSRSCGPRGGTRAGRRP
ncbi:hypothetical protein [Dactylosporangium sp. NPDC048998]|uniref:hypothetical protein n=1 Tax=Dactylosporangium sp. NPDC048998 TaxID=3363976 RepID=UPI0037248C19